MIISQNNFLIKEKSFIHVGGEVKEYIECDDLKQAIECLSNKKRFIALGNTSKILFCFDKCEITFFRFLKKKIVFRNDDFFVYSGVSLNYLNHVLMERNITGFEYLSTIPGLIGGSIVNNASFLEQGISDLLIEILVWENKKFTIIKKEDIRFSYRESGLIKDNFFIVGARFKIQHDYRSKINKRYLKALEYRRKKQNISLHTLGSTFKNINDIKIGQVLDSLGYRGFHLDKTCRVSQLHANFIVVDNNANYQEVYNLINFLKEVLYNYLKLKIRLEIQVILEDGRVND